MKILLLDIAFSENPSTREGMFSSPLNKSAILSTIFTKPEILIPIIFLR